MVDRERQAGANATAELPFCNLRAHTPQIHAFIFHLCPHSTTVCVCVCVCPHMHACVFRQASGRHGGFCTSCVGHVEEDASKGQELAAGEEGGSPAVCEGSEPRSCFCSDRLGERQFRQGGEKQRTKGARVRLLNQISTLAH